MLAATYQTPLVSPFAKQASELGGEGNETSYEQALSTIAYPYLRDKAPRFVNSLQGFQLLDKDEDGSKATGVFGFKQANRWYYVPVVFNGGKVKGHELLYSVADKQFVPFKENWVNAIMSQKPGILGDDVSRNMRDLGVREPNLGPHLMSPQKYASNLDHHYLPAAQVLAELIDAPPAQGLTDSNLDLQAFLKKAGVESVEQLVGACQRYPLLAEGMGGLYGDLPAFFRSCLPAKQANEGILSEFPHFPGRLEGDEAEDSINDTLYRKKQRRRKIPSSLFDDVPDEGALKTATSSGKQVDVIEYAGNEGVMPSGISAEERKQLMRDGVALRDRRNDRDINMAYRIQTDTQLTNPTMTGIWPVLLAEGVFERCLVIINPSTPSGDKSCATVISLEDKRRWQNVHPSLVWIRQDNEPPAEGKESVQVDFRAWLKDQPEANELPVSEDYDGPLFVLIGPSGGTTPFSVLSRMLRSELANVYRCSFRDWSDQQRPAHLPPLNRPRVLPTTPGAGERVHFTERSGTKMVSYGNDLYVPNGFKLLRLEKDKDSDTNRERDSDKDKDRDGYRDGYLNSNIDSDINIDIDIDIDSENNTELDPFMVGQPTDLTKVMYQKTAALTMRRDGNEVWLNKEASVSFKQALISLVTEVGLRESQARLLLKEAEQKPVNCRVKCADPWDLQRSGPSVNVDDEPLTGQEGLHGSIPAQYYTQRQTVLDTNLANPADVRQSLLEGPVNNQDSQVMTQGARSGDKKLFEALAIGTLIKSRSDDSLIDDHLPALRQALDRVGKILLAFHLHSDRFAERYGKADLQEIEDGARASFDDLGDLVLKLEEKAIRPEMDASGVGSQDQDA